MSRSFILLFVTFILHHGSILEKAFFLSWYFTVKKLENYHKSPIRFGFAQVAVKKKKTGGATRVKKRKKGIKSTDPSIIIYIANLKKYCSGKMIQIR